MPNSDHAPFSLDALNSATLAEACRMMAQIIERSPWLADIIARARPFASAAALGDQIRNVIVSLPQQDALNLLNAHPELAPPSSTGMTKASQSEQGRLKLLTPMAEVARRLTALNSDYFARHGFPFVIALHNYQTIQDVIVQFECRLDADTPTEMRRALVEVVSVATERLDQALGAATSDASCSDPTTAPTLSRKVAQ